VDSSIAAAMLLKQGYEVVGITMRVWSGDEPQTDVARACCSERAVRDARDVAARLSIKHYVVNYIEPFHDLVIQDFIATYLKGETPNPCIRCNRYVKFGKLLEEAVALGADYLASGHYARIQLDESSGRFLLMKGADKQKDQSYALYSLTQKQLSKLMFPLGDRRKADTRRIAQELGLRVAHKTDSQEICFIPNGDYGAFLKKHVRETFEPGPILTLDGSEIGKHRGLPFYTVGQRKGLGIPAGEPLYVVRLDPTRNALIVGPDSAVWGKEFQARDVNWIAISHAPKEIRGTGCHNTCLGRAQRPRALRGPATRHHPRSSGGLLRRRHRARRRDDNKHRRITALASPDWVASLASMLHSTRLSRQAGKK